MADDADNAANYTDLEISQALSKLKQNAQTNQVGSKICVECGDDMPELRQTLGFKLCKDCAEEREKRQSMFAD